jgi:hypothetical protein
VADRWRIRSNTGCDHYHDEPCARCDATRKRPLGSRRLAVHRFYEGFYPHITGPLEPEIYITSPEQLRRECRKRGLTSQYLEDREIWRKREPSRWI